MITCGMKVEESEEKDVGEYILYDHHGTLMRMCHKNCGKNCLVTVKKWKKTILKVLICYLVVIENKNQNKILYYFLSQN